MERSRLYGMPDKMGPQKGSFSASVLIVPTQQTRGSYHIRPGQKSAPCVITKGSSSRIEKKCMVVKRLQDAC